MNREYANGVHHNEAGEPVHPSNSTDPKVRKAFDAGVVAVLESLLDDGDLTIFHAGEVLKAIALDPDVVADFAIDLQADATHAGIGRPDWADPFFVGQRVYVTDVGPATVTHVYPEGDALDVVNARGEEATVDPSLATRQPALDAYVTHEADRALVEAGEHRLPVGRIINDRVERGIYDEAEEQAIRLILARQEA